MTCVTRVIKTVLVWLASLSLLVAFIGAMTVQFIGGARLLDTAAGIPYNTSLLIFGISTALYTAFGGFRTSVLNDTMQGLVMLIGTLLLLVAVIHAAGGLHHAVNKLAAIDPKLVSAHGAGDILSPTFMTSFWILVCFGVIGLPHTAVRCISYKDSKAVHQGIIIGTVVVAILMFGMHLVTSRLVARCYQISRTRSGYSHAYGSRPATFCCRDLSRRSDGSRNVYH